MLALLGSCDSRPAQAPQPETNPVIETMLSRRSVRRYLPQAVGRDTMRTIAECGINAPNASNRQHWAVRIVDDPAYIDGITALYKEANPKAAEDPSFRNMFRNAPTVAFVAAPSEGFAQVDCGLLGENMMLAAWSMGVGSCCLGGPVRFMQSPEAADYVTRLGLPEGYELLFAIAFGYPDEQPEAKPRDASKVAFVE